MTRPIAPAGSRSLIADMRGLRTRSTARARMSGGLTRARTHYLYDPAANLCAGLNYAIHTYGSIHNVPGLVSLRNGSGYVGYIAPRL